MVKEHKQFIKEQYKWPRRIQKKVEPCQRNTNNDFHQVAMTFKIDFFLKLPEVTVQ